MNTPRVAHSFIQPQAKKNSPRHTPPIQNLALCCSATMGNCQSWSSRRLHTRMPSGAADASTSTCSRCSRFHLPSSIPNSIQGCPLKEPDKYHTDGCPRGAGSSRPKGREPHAKGQGAPSQRAKYPKPKSRAPATQSQRQGAPNQRAGRSKPKGREPQAKRARGALSW